MADDRFRDFDAAIDEEQPITFRLGGSDWQAIHLNATNFLRFTRKTAEGGAEAAVAFQDYLTAVLGEDDRKPFMEMLDERDVSLTVLLELVKWLVEQSSGVPSPAAVPSPSRQRNSGGPTRVVRLDGGPTSVSARSGVG